MERGATFVYINRENWGEVAREALPDKGFRGCATKVDKSDKCRTPLEGGKRGEYGFEIFGLLGSL